MTRFGLCPATCESVQYCLICCWWCRWKTAAAGKSTTFCCCWWCCFRKYKWYLNLLRNRQGWLLIFQMMKQWSFSTYFLPNYKIKKRMKVVLCSVLLCCEFVFYSEELVKQLHSNNNFVRIWWGKLQQL